LSFGFAPELHAASLRAHPASVRSILDEFALELRESVEDGQHQPAMRRGGIRPSILDRPETGARFADLVDGGRITDELFPRKGAAETSRAAGTRQIICRKGLERGCHNGVGAFAGKFHASFGQLLVILGDQHRVLALQPLAKGSRHLFLARNPALLAGSSGRRSDPAGAPLLFNRVRP
jgi:hypothetical protein